MSNFTIFYMFENPRRGRQARSFTTNVPKILDLKSSSEQIFFRKLSLGAPGDQKRNQEATYSRRFMIYLLKVFHFLLYRRSSILQDIYFLYRIRRFVSELIQGRTIKFLSGWKGGAGAISSEYEFFFFYFQHYYLQEFFFSPK